MIPTALMVSRQIAPESFFSETEFLGSHDTVLLAVKNGDADAGWISSSIAASLIRSGELKDGELRMLWQSDPIPGSPFVARKRLSDRLKKRFVEAMLALHERDPEALTAFDPAIVRYVSIGEREFDGIRNIVEILGPETARRDLMGK